MALLMALTRGPHPVAGILREDWRLLLAPAILLLYYAVMWFLVGRDPKPGEMIVRYQPPAGISPAAARYIMTTGSDGKSVAAVLARLAGRGRISIQPQPGGYRVSRRDGNGQSQTTLEPEEAKVLELLFVSGDSTLLGPMAQANSGLVAAIQESLRARFEGIYFKDNLGYVLLGGLGTAIAGAIMGYMSPARDIFFLTVWFLLFSLGLGAIIAVRVIPAIKDLMRGRLGLRNSLTTLLPAIFILGLPGIVAYHLAKDSSVMFVAALLAMVIINVGFGSLLKTPTALGRKTLDEIAGFRQFLITVERDPLQRLNPRNLSPELVGDNLPYAIALEIKEAWGDHLSDALFSATVAR